MSKEQDERAIAFLTSVPFGAEDIRRPFWDLASLSFRWVEDYEAERDWKNQAFLKEKLLKAMDQVKAILK